MKIFKTVFATLILILGGFSIASAQILYRVESPKSEKVSYIMGTHHFAPVAVIDSISELPEILNGIDKLYGEIEMSTMLDQANLMKMRQYMVAPEDSTLDKVLSAEQLQKLSDSLNSLTGAQVPLDMFYGMKPAVISAQLAALLTQRDFPELNPVEGIDMTMQRKANEIGKSVAGLETLEQQMELLYNNPISQQAEDLMETIDDLSSAEREARAIAAAYINHDMDAILKVMQDEIKDPKELDRMIYDRNANWIQILTKELPSESLMIVVGAGHLPGEKGLLQGLRNNGFSVTPVF